MTLPAGCALPRLGEFGARLDAAPPQTLGLSDDGDEQAEAPAGPPRYRRLYEWANWAAHSPIV